MKDIIKAAIVANVVASAGQNTTQKKEEYTDTGYSPGMVFLDLGLFWVVQPLAAYAVGAFMRSLFPDAMASNFENLYLAVAQLIFGAAFFWLLYVRSRDHGKNCVLFIGFQAFFTFVASILYIVGVPMYLYKYIVG